jgi:hypothetical protein
MEGVAVAMKESDEEEEDAESDGRSLAVSSERRFGTLGDTSEIHLSFC